MRFVLAPGIGQDDSTSSHWYPWLAHEVSSRGYEFVLRNFPDPYGAHECEWIPFLLRDLGAGADTVVIGHSSGAIAAMRLAENTRLAGIVLVSAYTTDLGDPRETESGYFCRPWDWDSIRRNCGFILQFHSVDDPYVPVDAARVVKDELAGSIEYTELGCGGHFLEGVFPQLLDAVMHKASVALVDGPEQDPEMCASSP
eukprot:m51a1_g2226 hypothetical protein (199) ;mRNA; f:235272-235868